MPPIAQDRDMTVRFWHRITTKSKVLFYTHLGNLLEGGVPIIASLRSFLEKTDNPIFFRAVEDMLFFVESGNSLNIAMRKLPLVFSKREVAIIESGESSGTLQKSFVSLSEELRTEDELRGKITAALTYPGIIMLFLVGALVIIMTFVIPKLIPLFTQSGTDLPPITQALVSMSGLFVNHYFWIIIIIGLIVVMFRWYIATNTGKRQFDIVMIRFPVIGDVYRNYCIVRIASSMSLLLGSGIPILKTLQLTGEGLNNRIYQDAFGRIIKGVTLGKKLGASMEDSDPAFELFTRDFVQMIVAGEQTSTVNRVCEKMAEQYRREVDHSLVVLMKYIEPLAILVAGGFVLWFAFGIFSAVVKITETTGG